MNLYIIIINDCNDDKITFDEIDYHHINASSRKEAIKSFINSIDSKMIDFLYNLNKEKNVLNFVAVDAHQSYYNSVKIINDFFEDLDTKNYDDLICNKKKRAVKKFIYQHFDEIFNIVDYHSKHSHNIIVNKVKI